MANSLPILSNYHVKSGSYHDMDIHTIQLMDSYIFEVTSKSLFCWRNHDIFGTLCRHYLNQPYLLKTIFINVFVFFCTLFSFPISVVEDWMVQVYFLSIYRINFTKYCMFAVCSTNNVIIK